MRAVNLLKLAVLEHFTHSYFRVKSQVDPCSGNEQRFLRDCIANNACDDCPRYVSSGIDSCDVFQYDYCAHTCCDECKEELDSFAACAIQEISGPCSIPSACGCDYFVDVMRQSATDNCCFPQSTGGGSLGSKCLEGLCELPPRGVLLYATCADYEEAYCKTNCCSDFGGRREWANCARKLVMEATPCPVIPQCDDVTSTPAPTVTPSSSIPVANPPTQSPTTKSIPQPFITPQPSRVSPTNIVLAPVLPIPTPPTRRPTLTITTVPLVQSASPLGSQEPNQGGKGRGKGTTQAKKRPSRKRNKGKGMKKRRDRMSRQRPKNVFLRSSRSS